MNKYNYFVKLLLAFLLIVNAYLMWKNQNQVKESRAPKAQISTDTALLKDIGLCTYYENAVLGQNLSNSDIESPYPDINLSDITGNTGLIIFRYNEIHCDICVDSTILILNELRDKVDANKILYLTTYKNARDKVNFQRVNNISSPVYNISKLNTTLENVERPYILHLDKDQKIVGAMIADKDQLFRLRAFINSMKAKF